MQRYLRDVATYRTHVNAQHSWWAMGYARSLLGLESPA
jgi:3-hydroxy-9,10-secoandrosta-1,3,5(10)-triene-9,17-dione monooxygenase